MCYIECKFFAFGYARDQIQKSADRQTEHELIEAESGIEAGSIQKLVEYGIEQTACEYRYPPYRILFTCRACRSPYFPVLRSAISTV